MVSRKKKELRRNSSIDSHFIGGRVDGALGDVADRSGKKPNLNQWLLRDCAAASRDQPSRKEKSNIIECHSNDDVSRSLRRIQ